MPPQARNKFDAPMFEPEVFRKQMNSRFEKIAYGIVVTFSLPRRDSAPGELCPLTPPPCPTRYVSGVMQ